VSFICCAPQIITDRESGNSKGYCFVTFGDERDAQDALATGTGK
jgi:RNA recognition motif-containing protein